jgi:hypothetical protein
VYSVSGFSAPCGRSTRVRSARPASAWLRYGSASADHCACGTTLTATTRPAAAQLQRGRQRVLLDLLVEAHDHVRVEPACSHSAGCTDSIASSGVENCHCHRLGQLRPAVAFSPAAIVAVYVVENGMRPSGSNAIICVPSQR